MYVYIKSRESGDDGYVSYLYTVGFYDPSGKWEPESDHADKETAAKRVAWLNGRNESLEQALNSGDGTYRP